MPRHRHVQPDATMPSAPASGASDGAVRRRRRWWPVWRPAGVSAAALVALVLVAATAPSTHGEPLPDMDGHLVVADPGSVPSVSEVSRMKLVDDIGMRVQVPKVGLDAPLGEMNEVDGMIRPPGFTSVYLVRNMGVDLDHASEGTVYMATHSVRGGRAPGNYLINIPQGIATVGPGDEVRVSDLVYHVTAVELIPKTQLPSVARLWEPQPGRLVLVTCLQRAAGRSLKNLVVEATLAE
ncbi:class F sortase [Xylanimonas allomyrinae]|uniref:Class F sortase n=1 Tax=Xylanimonas allomyrinae TaxID=2509459 RepID=A0A4P6EPP9_9MICO|nr:class F sortase [Xylanimonas allomyrinae]QAY63783.1 class F sortase [Xylanimonas allomyrinae]